MVSEAKLSFQALTCLEWVHELRKLGSHFKSHKGVWDRTCTLSEEGMQYQLLWNSSRTRSMPRRRQPSRTPIVSYSQRWKERGAREVSTFVFCFDNNSPPVDDQVRMQV